LVSVLNHTFGSSARRNQVHPFVDVNLVTMLRRRPPSSRRGFVPDSCRFGMLLAWLDGAISRDEG
jgi:hypothetical protein